MPSRRALLLVLAAALLALAAWPRAAEAQYFRFGKNKIQYERLDWQYLQSTHFDVYYYEPGGQALAAFAARAAEEAYAEIEALFAHALTERVAILVYQSHNDFAVTNAVDLPPYAEGIGGVTELFKNRIAVPFTGDYRDFRRVLHHELVHAVVNDLFYGGSLQSVIRSGLSLRIPLWFNEGLAEYAALGWDTHSDMYVRDAVVHDELARIEGLHGYFAYRGGQALWDYVAAQYGREKLTEILQRLLVGRSVEGAFRRALGLSLEELSERWHDALRTVYFPEVAARERLEDVARALVTEENGSSYNTSAALSPQGDRLAFLGARGALFDVYLVSTTGEARPERLVAGQRSPEFESLRILSPGLAWAPDGRRLAVAVKSGPSDAIALLDVETRRATHLRIPGLDAVVSLAWAPDGRRIAFEGTQGPNSDLYVLDLETGETTNLTNDLFSDHEPAWSPDGKALVFHSDRGEHLETGRATAESGFDLLAHDFAGYDLYRLDLERPGRLERLTNDEDWDARSPAFGDDPERLLFVSDRNGIPNLYEKNLATGAERPLTDLLEGVMQLSLSADGRRAALVALREGVPSIYLLRDPFAREAERDPLPPTVWAQRVMGERAPGPAPALALASAATVRANPFLRDAAAGHPFTADPMRRRRLPKEALAQARQENSLGGFGFDLDDGEPDDGEAPGAEQDTTAYGEIRVDFRSYTFSPAFEEARLEREAERRPRFEPEDHLEPDGSFKPKRYRLRFSPDLVYGNVGYDAIFGVQSITQMAFSDVLGNHRIFAATNLIIDLRNSDYILGYEYLARRVDYAVSGFHLARQLTDFGRQAIFRYRNYGLVLAASYPLSKFRRLEAELSLQGVSLTDLAAPALRSRSRTFLHPALTYTVDATEPGFLYPAGGHRLALRLSGSPGPEIAFASLLADARAYWGGYLYGLALRASAGLSVGPDPQRFYAAGVQNWINPTLRSIPIESEDDFVFATPVLPLRGFGFDEASGDRFGLLNAEFRFPLVAALLPGPLPVLPLYALQGTAFADAGVIARGRFNAWRLDEEGRRVLDDVLLGAGLGLRTIVLGYPLRLDWAWPYDGRGFGRHRFYFSIGLDF